MKKILGAMLLTLTLSFSVWAGPVFLYPTCSNWGHYGECTLNNTSDQSVSCSINVSGSTRKGQMISQYQYAILSPFQMTWVRVSPRDSQNDSLSYLTANAFCNTL